MNESFTCKFKIVEQKSKHRNNENKINMMKLAVFTTSKETNNNNNTNCWGI